MPLVSSKDLNPATDLNAVEAGLREAAANKADPAHVQNEPKTADSVTVVSLPDDDKIPAKFRGKTVADILDSYRNLESDYGRIANELGTQRKLTDRLLDIDNETRQAAKAAVKTAVRKLPELSSTELLTNPAEAITRVLDEHSKQITAPTEDRLSKLEASLAEQAFMERHPGCVAAAKTPEFQAWLQATPSRKLTQARAAQGDLAAADALFTEYEQAQAAAATKQQPNQDDAAALEQARQIGLESGSGGSNSSAASGKIWNREDIIKLRMFKPDVYSDPAVQAEIMAAYAEGRVK